MAPTSRSCEFGRDGVACSRPATVYGGFGGAGDWAGYACAEHSAAHRFMVWHRLPASPASPEAAQIYHVPRSQVWAGSRGRQSGNIHLHVTTDFSSGRLRRSAGAALCGRRGWYERPADADDAARHAICPSCAATAARHGVVTLPV